MSSTPEPQGNSHSHALALPDGSGAVPTSTEARAKRHIAALEEELDMMKQERGTKQRKTTYFIAQGRAICQMVVLYTSLEDLITENDRRYEEQMEPSTPESLASWLHEKLTVFDMDDAEDMLKKLKKGADAARSDDTSTLKDIKQSCSFAHDVCGNLLCPAEWDWDNGRNLENGLFKSKILVQAFKATFMSPSSAREADGDGNGADILKNNRHAQWASSQVKVKTCIASIINMRKVTPHAIAYIVCQVRFALSGITSWHTVEGDFNYEMFWNNVVDFFEDVPGLVAQCRVTQLLEWWTRKIFRRNHHEDLTPEVVSQMSVTALADQRRALEDAAFDLE
ncbi:hypothetical protein BD769DRAFT_1666406 [Suillus cothurnatus]|nr:hypothetical protein BD769DRAFT_1666406 [Suillus cothurnatus]